MRSLLTFGVLTLLALNSCSSKNQSPQTHVFPGPAPVKLLDADRDGLSDPFEKKIGMSSSVASFPSFTKVGKVQTQLTFSQKSVDTKNLTWQTPQDVNSPSLKRPHRIQMAKQAFKRKFKFEKSDHIISFSPLPRFNLTEILFHQWHKFKSFPLLEHTTLSLETTLPVKLINFKGIEELNKITARVGFYENEHFIPLTHRFILKDETGKALSLGKKKNSSVILLNINIERKELINRLVRNQKQIILEFCDFEATTQEHSHYNFSEQWNYATSALRPFLISTPQKDKIILIDKNLNFKEALKKVSKDFRMNREEEVESLSGLNDETTGPSPLLKMDSQQLQEHSWFEFKQDHLYALAYFSNLDLAQANHELIAHNLFQIKDNASQEDLGKLRVGEVLSLRFKGSYHTAHPIQEKNRENITYQTYILGPPRSRCRATLIHSCYGDRNAEPLGPLPYRQLVKKQTSCLKTMQKAQWVEEKINSPAIIYFETSMGELIQLTDLYEETKARPISNENNDEFELQFTITEHFINRYGDKLKLRIHDMRTIDQFDIGTLDVRCEDNLPSNYNYPAQFGGKGPENFEQHNDIHLEFKKSF